MWTASYLLTVFANFSLFPFVASRPLKTSMEVTVPRPVDAPDLPMQNQGLYGQSGVRFRIQGQNQTGKLRPGRVCDYASQDPQGVGLGLALAHLSLCLF